MACKFSEYVTIGLSRASTTAPTHPCPHSALVEGYFWEAKHLVSAHTYGGQLSVLRRPENALRWSFRKSSLYLGSPFRCLPGRSRDMSGAATELLRTPAPSQPTPELLLLLQPSAMGSPPPCSPPCIPTNRPHSHDSPRACPWLLNCPLPFSSLNCKVLWPAMLSTTFCNCRSSPVPSTSLAT